MPRFRIQPIVLFGLVALAGFGCQKTSGRADDSAGQAEFVALVDRVVLLQRRYQAADSVSSDDCAALPASDGHTGLAEAHQSYRPRR